MISNVVFAYFVLISAVAAGLKLQMPKRWLTIPSLIASTAIAIGNPGEAFANREVAKIATSGLIFKDSLKVNAFQDPKVKGVTLYLSDFERPITEKIAGGDIFNDPSSVSLTCVPNGPVIVSKDVSLDKSGEEVFEESRNLFFKVPVQYLIATLYC